MKSDAAFLLRHPAHFLALGFGAGLSPRAPGTVGTVVGFFLFLALDPVVAPAQWILLTAILFAIGGWACEVTGRNLGVADHGAMCWDEIVAIFLVLAVLPRDWRWQLAGFALFRIFDITKPPPIGLLERRIKGGLGVMLDDVLAAGYTLLVLAVVSRIIGA
jgi:phosphatidylglycerophosphatase A